MSDSYQSPDSADPLSVSQLNRQVKRILEGHFDFVWVEGEVSNLARPGSGHWYFTLKDAAAQVRCAMFRNRNQRARIEPRDGQQLLVRARVSLYEGRGEYQLIVEHIEDAGAGALQREFEALKARLLAEGLFETERKLALPEFPSQIALITSPTGAVIRDLLSVFARRFPPLELTLLPVPVQGEGAAEAIVSALKQADSLGFDALVIARGGGSLEDLWSFNNEQLARAIADCQTPVVSAVGHETDFTIADFAADHRAPTPSAAAEVLSPDRGELLLRLRTLETALARAIRQQMRLSEEQLAGLRRYLRHPGEELAEQSQWLDDLEARLRRALLGGMKHRRSAAQMQLARLSRHSPLAAIRQARLVLDGRVQGLSHHFRARLQRDEGRLSTISARLKGVSPLATLERGYAIVTDESGQVLRDAGQVSEGDAISTRLARGFIDSTVTNKRTAD